MLIDDRGFRDDFDSRLRTAAFSWLTDRANHGIENISYSELQSFTFEGRNFPLKDRVKGIWKPANLTSALSITTTYRPPGVERSYDDLIHESDGLLRYKWNGIERNEATNRALRSAMQVGVPLIWFFGVGKGVFKPIFPVYVVNEEEVNQQFLLDADSSANSTQVEGAAENFFAATSKWRPDTDFSRQSSGEQSCGPTEDAAQCAAFSTANCWTQLT